MDFIHCFCIIKVMVKSYLYALTKEEYESLLIEKAKYYLSNVKLTDNEKEEYFKKLFDQVVKYAIDKSWFDSLSEEEKIKVEISDFVWRLKSETEETRELKYFLMHGDIDKTGEFCIDTSDVKTIAIKSEFEEKVKKYKAYVTSKIANVTFDPELTDKDIEDLVFKMIINEYARINANLVNYNFLMTFFASYYSNEFKVDIKDVSTIKTSILMFLLTTDYEKNKVKYDTYKFSNIDIEYIKGIKNGTKDDLTMRAENKEVSKIIRDAASHGEFYPSGTIKNRSDSNITSAIKIENSGLIPRMGLILEYEELEKFILTNLTEDTKEKYSFLVKLIEAEDIEKPLKSANKDALKQMLILLLNDIVQYNTEHHFKTESTTDEFDLSAFTFTNELDNGKDISNKINSKQKLMNIKNALGHDNVVWNGDTIELHNIWNGRRNKHIKATCNLSNLIMTFIGYSIYDFSIMSSSSIETYKKTHNKII